MTTICTDGHAMGGDGRQVTRGTIAGENGVKVHRLKDGSLFGACGSAGDADQVIEWLDTKDAERPAVGDDFGALLLDGTGIRSCGHKLIFTAIEAPAAIGSGMDYAYGALDVGASVEEALTAASKRDAYTGGVLTVLEFGK